MKKHPEFKYNPYAADLDYDRDNNYWYSDWHNSTLVVLSYTWVQVENFRNYMKNSRKADVFTYSQTNADWKKLMQRAWIGDVVQCGNSHSILIEYVNSKDENGIKYAAHSKNANDREFSNFKRWCKSEHPNDNIYLISFK